MAISFKNKIIWITGASSGIGEMIAYEFSKHNVTLILSGRNKENLGRVAERCRELGSEAYIFPFDLSVASQCETVADEVLKQFKYVDILVNNGGISQRSLLVETPVEIDRQLMEVDFFSGVILTKKVLPSMIQRRSGHIVAISSVMGLFGFPLRSGYAAAKHAMVGFYETLWTELSLKGIDVTIVCPGRIRTDISINSITSNGTSYGIMDHGQEGGLSVEKCAKKIVKAIKRKKVEVVIGNKELFMTYLKRYIPYFYYKLATRISPT
jgi:dehydrogenase/reductase SDR family member 7B